MVGQIYHLWVFDRQILTTVNCEFLAATVHLKKLEEEEILFSALSFFDKDCSGYITVDELQEACKEFGLSEVHLDEVIKEIDEDKVSSSHSDLF